MTLEEACLYLNINPDDDDIDLEQLERNYKTKLSIYDVKRFNDSDSPEYKEAKKIRASIEEAYKYLLDVYAQIHEEPKQKIDKTDKGDNWLLKTALCMTTIAALFLTGLVYFMNRQPQEKLEKLDSHIVSPIPNYERDKRYDELQKQLDDLKKRMKESQTQNQNQSQSKYADVIERSKPSMVFIQTDKMLGSGFFVSPNGDILTNHHVIANAEYIIVNIYNGKSVEALVKDFDADQDMALLKTNWISANYLRISNTIPRHGEEVIAIGNPRGFIDTVSNGIVSGLRKDENNNNVWWLQFTAPISPGSSGGALINLNGEVAGMPTKYRTDGQNLNFAVPSTVLTQFLNSAINKPARALANSPARRAAPDNNNNRTEQGQYKFVRKDDGYEMYLDTKNIEYDKRTRTASFITIWVPTEKSKIEMRRSPDFNIPIGQDVDICALLYNVNFRDNKYVHLKTINFCTDGTIARDYTKPDNEIIWRTPKRGSRIESLMKEVRKLLRI